jgi:hypothetical protein
MGRVHRFLGHSFHPLEASAGRPFLTTGAKCSAICTSTRLWRFFILQTVSSGDPCGGRHAAPARSATTDQALHEGRIRPSSHRTGQTACEASRHPMQIPRAEHHPKGRRNSGTMVKNWSIVSIHEGIACRIIDQGEKHVSPRGKTGESDELYRSEKPL